MNANKFYRVSAPAIFLGVLCFFIMEISSGCREIGVEPNIFSIEDEIRLGEQVAAQIASSPAEYPVLDRNRYPEAYEHLERIRNTILETGQIKYRDRFSWNVTIIHNDEVLNAFVTPGGHIYVYTGLIKFLDKESELAGVMGHEIAHADQRHVTERLTLQFGLQVLMRVVFGEDPGTLVKIAEGLTTLAFSRSNESEADAFSVEYLCKTEYDSKGTAGFFQKLIDEGKSGNTPQFLSTHPNPNNRVEAITQKSNKLNCQTSGQFIERYNQFKAALP